MLHEARLEHPGRDVQFSKVKFASDLIQSFVEVDTGLFPGERTTRALFDFRNPGGIITRIVRRDGIHELERQGSALSRIELERLGKYLLSWTHA